MTHSHQTPHTQSHTNRKDLTMSNTQPAATFRDGTIKATIWANSNDRGTFYTVKLVNAYKDQQGTWQDSDSLTGNDTLRAANLLTRAHNWIIDQKAA